ncbi:MAG TPA: amino acid ABC transporter permease [Bordetella sp.]
MKLDFSLLLQFGPDLLQGFFNTIKIWLSAALLAALIGSVLGFAMTVGPRRLRQAITCYVEFFRCTPFLVQLFLFYFGGPSIGLTLDAYPVGIIGLGLYGGAYFTATMHAGFNSIPKGQIEAAQSFGISRWQTVRHVVLPQMLVLIIPPGINLLIFMIKDTAVLSIITVPELTFQITNITQETYAFVEPYLALALGYWVLVEITARLGRLGESLATRHLGKAA